MDIKPGHYLAAGIPGGLALVGMEYIPSTQAWARDCLMLLGILLCGVACALFIFWAFDMVISLREREADARDRRYKLGQLYKEMTQPQIDAMNKALMIGIDVDLQGGKWLHGTDVPLSFVETFLSLCSQYSLVPIGHWNDSKAQDLAGAVTDEFISAGVAFRARGNQPATWAQNVSKWTVARILGIELPPPPHQEIKGR